MRFYSAHVYNNYYDGNDKYGAGSTMSSSIFEEGNYFRNCKYPMLTSLQGSDIWDESKSADNTSLGAFSSEDGGTIKAWNNYMEGQKRFVAYNDAAYPNSKVDFDAYVAASRTEKVPATVKTASGGYTYNNFDTDNSVMYTYTADDPQTARANVIAHAGRMQGGDLQWTFDNAVDDTSAALNAGLKAEVVGYTTALVYIQGEGAPPTTSIQARVGSGSNPILVDARRRRLDPPIGGALHGQGRARPAGLRKGRSLLRPAGPRHLRREDPHRSRILRNIRPEEQLRQHRRFAGGKGALPGALDQTEPDEAVQERPDQQHGDVEDDQCGPGAIRPRIDHEIPDTRDHHQHEHQDLQGESPSLLWCRPAGSVPGSASHSAQSLFTNASVSIGLSSRG